MITSEGSMFGKPFALFSVYSTHKRLLSRKCAWTISLIIYRLCLSRDGSPRCWSQVGTLRLGPLLLATTTQSQTTTYSYFKRPVPVEYYGLRPTDNKPWVLQVSSSIFCSTADNLFKVKEYFKNWELYSLTFLNRYFHTHLFKCIP